jgi:hypothetical protein
MNETLTIIFRASDHKFGVHAKDRFYSTSKSEVSKTCFNSFYYSFKKYKNRVVFKVIGDRLSDDLKRFFEKFDDVTLIPYNGGNKTGLRDNIDVVLQEAYKTNTDWVWIQEDDYLFVDNASDIFFDLIDNKEEIIKSNKNLVVYPADYSDRYTRHKDINKKYQLFLGKYSYWREIHNTTFSWCVHKKYLNNMKPLFDQMFNEVRFKKFDTYLSDKVWNNPNTLVVSPLPSCSVHLDSHVRLPPCINWNEIWSKNVRL